MNNRNMNRDGSRRRNREFGYGRDGRDCQELFYNSIFGVTSILGILILLKLPATKYLTGIIDKNTSKAMKIFFCTGIFGMKYSYSRFKGERQGNLFMISAFIVIFLLDLYAAYICYVEYVQLNDIIEKEFDKAIIQHYEDIPVSQARWDVMQKNLNCCGIYNQNDWPTNNLPKSCCNELFIGHNNCTKNEPYVHQEGCLYKLSDVLVWRPLILGSFGIFSALIQLVLIYWIYSLYVSWT